MEDLPVSGTVKASTAVTMMSFHYQFIMMRDHGA